MTASPPSRELATAVEAAVLSLAGDVAGCTFDASAAERPLHALGFDSVQYVELSGCLNEYYGLDLAPTLFFDVHAPRRIAAHLLARHPLEVARKHGVASGDESDALARAGAASDGGRERTGARDETAAHERESAGDIAIVGMAGIFPQSADLDAFWRHLAAGDDLIAEAPASRWDWRAADGESASRWGGFIPRIEYFDAAFFGISPREAEQMDPQQRLLMQTAWAALEDAAVRPSDLMGSDTAVFVGVSTSDYLDLLPGADGHLAVGNAHAMLPNRLSHLLGAHGPSEAVDTACSSSLVALHRALCALRRGESGVAIVGGVNVMLTTRLHRALAAAGMLSPDGRCKTFDAAANGYVRGEGIAALVLMPLERARAGGHPVHAVIKGSAVNHGGRAAFLTAPDINAQAALIEAAYRDAGVDPATVSYIEAHGTGTSLGDPIEVQALRQGFDACARARGHADAPAPARCGLGSVKTNIGHLEAAAGLAGVVKVVLAMNRRMLPPSLHCRELNPYLKLDGSRYHVVTEPVPWPGDATPTPLRAGVSSFGFGGSNAHVVLQSADARPNDRPSAPRPPIAHEQAEAGAADAAGPLAWFIPLSARTDTALRARAAQLACWLDAERADDAWLPALAKTLSIGREPMACRFGVTCASLDSLRAQLAVALNGPAASLARDDARLQPHANAHAAWLAGGADPLPVAWDEATPRLRLPVYPFEGERHWPTDAVPPARFTLAPEGDGAYRMHVAPDAPLVADHRLGGEPVLAAAAQIVIAWRAFEADANAADSSRASEAGEPSQPDERNEPNGSSRAIGSKGSNPAGAAIDSTDAGGSRVSSNTADANAATQITLRDIEWLAPIAIGAPADLHVTLAREERSNANEDRRGNAHRREIGNAARFAIAVAPAIDAPLGRGYAARIARAPTNAPALDVDAICARCTQPIAADACYDAFAAIGIGYGPTFRPLRAIAVGRDEAFAEFDPSALARTTGDARIVALLDGAFQAIAGLQLADAGRLEGGLLPASLARIEFTGPLADSTHAWIREAPGETGRRTFDIDLVTARGVPCASLRGLALASGRGGASREAPRVATPGDHLLAPQWLPCTANAPSAATPPQRAGAPAILGGTPAQRAALAATLATPPRLIDDIAELNAHVDHLVWLPPAPAHAHAPLARCAGLDGFRLVKRLLALGAGERAFELTVLTVRSWTMPGDAPAFPAHADLAGLCGSLANEYPHWRVRLIDLSDADALPADWRTQDTEGGHPLLHRHGQWFARRLVPLAALPSPATPPYRPGGVYVAIGGAGGLGRVWTGHAIRACGAQVVWIGRRPLDAQIDAHCDALAEFGPRPSYLSTDASDVDSLRDARDAVLARFGRIDGVVHTAIVLQDGGLAQLDEAQFSAALNAQVATTANLARVFGGDSLDFILFFSSLQSAFVAAGQSNYAAGCTFRDAFADWLRTQLRCAVKVVSWGYWGQTGVVASEPYRKRMAALGIGSIEPAAAMAVVDALLAARVDQVGYLKTTARAAVPTLAPALAARIAPHTSALAGKPPPRIDETGASAAWNDALAALDRAIARRLFAELGALRAFGERDVADDGALGSVATGSDARGKRSSGERTFEPASFDIDAALRSGRIAPAYRRWLAHALALIAQHGHLDWDGRAGRLAEAPPPLDAARAEWAHARAQLDRTALLDAHLALADATLDALPAILQGSVPATSILFPDGDLSRVEAVYRRNEQADRCNRALADAVLHLVGGASSAQPAALAEIGAGTGGTTVPLLAALDASGARLAHYDFTDISKAFLLNAEQTFGRGRDTLRYRLFDVERPVAGQALDAGGYDIVIATNVLHATQDISVTLRNAKALLKTGGHLIVNELLGTHGFAHATFGLLPGWWRHRDSARRLPGSPLLSRDGWMRALREAGFAVPDGDSAGAAAAAGQGVIVAVSDGVIVQPAIADAGHAAHANADAQASAARPASFAASAAPARAASSIAAASSGAELRERCVQWLAQLVARTLKMPAGRLAPDQPLGSYGVDSILVIGLTKTLRETFGVALSNATLFEHATLSALADFFVAEHRAACERVLGGDAVAASAASSASAASASAIPNQAASNPLTSHAPMPMALATRATPPASPASPATATAADTAIAVIGMSGRYAQADNLREFWANLRAGRHCITEVPAERWDWRTHFDAEKGAPGRTYSRWGGFLKQIDRFDAAFFRIAPSDAEHIDPQGRLFLEEAWSAIEDAGYTPATLSANRQVGVFVGVMNGDYPTGAQFWSIANRVSHALDLHGPSLAVDTACSSSLTAIHLALDSLRSGTCDCALAGGVNLIQSPKHLVGLSSLTMLSAGDACRAFGAGADGFVDGEGVGVLVLKPLSRALADGDAIHGIIRGSMINAGGKTHGLTVPNPRAQQAVVAAALARSGVPARAVGYVEAHGTGTALGDPIELTGLTRAFAEATGDRGFCALGSVKSNIGHCESAAGVAGVTKVLLQMKHRELVPTLHADEPNPDLDFACSPFVLQRALAPWPKPDLDGWPRIAGVSSFGAGGANAHVVLEEFVDTRVAAPDDRAGPAIVVLSAATDDALRRRARQLHAALADGEIDDERLHDLAYTLQIGRDAMASRFGCVVGTVAELQAALAAFVEGDASRGWHAHRLAADRHGLAELDADPELRASLVEQCIAAGKLDRLAALWCQGLGVDWPALHRGHARRRVHLPTYPFDGPRHWLRDDATPATEPARAPADIADSHAAPPMRGASAGAPNVSTPDVAALVRRTVAQVLGYPDVDMNESFLSLGGDSIRAARAHRMLQRSLDVKIPLSLMLEAKTLAECARAIDALPPAEPPSAAGTPAAGAPPAEPRAPRASAFAPRDARPRVHTLSSNQRQFFFLDRLNPANPAFNLPGALRVRGEWHADALAAAYQALVDTHDVLRTRFVVRGGEPCAEVAPRRAAAIRHHDLSALLPKHQAARIAECLTGSSREGFALEQGEPSRLTVLELRDDDHVILLNLHHIVGDAVSVVVLLDVLARAALTGRASAPNRAQPQYAQWAAAERDALPATVERELPYWLERLRDVPPPLPLPCDRARPPVPSYRGRSVPLAFPSALTAQLDAYCKAHGLSRFVVMLAAFKVALRVLSGRDDIVVGSPYANRADDDTADMIGSLAYALVLRTRLGEAETFADAATLVRRTVHGAFDHLGVPYPRLVEALNPARHGGANPLYQIMFNVIPMPALPDGVEPVEVDSGWLDYDLFVRLRASGSAIEGVLQFSADLFDRSTAEAIATYYVELLHTLLAHPSLPLAGLAPPPELALERTIADAMPPLRIEIASTFTDRPLAGTLHYWGVATGQPIEPNFAPYGQLFQTLYDPSTPFHANRHGTNVVLVRPRDWLRFGQADADAETTDTAADAAAAQIALHAEELADALAGAAPSLAVPVLVLVLPDDASSLAAHGEQGGERDGEPAIDSSLAPYRTLAAALADLPSVTVAHWRDVAAIYPVADVFDPHADAAGHVPFTSEYYAALASYIARTAFQHASVPLDDAWNRLAAQIRDDAEHLLAAPADGARARRAPYAPPANEAQATLAPIFAAALKLADLGIDDNFFDCGGHSILAIGVVYQINEAFGTSLSVADIFMAPTVRRLAERMRDAPDGPEYVDLASAAVLPDDIAPLPGPVAGTPRALLLTGATGFVGRHLLRELIDRTDATIHCLVRAPDAAQGLARIRATLERWSLWRDGDDARVIAVPGDLGRPRIGLSEPDRARLVAEVDAIYHNGTSMNHLESFEMARAANVGGVIELLRIATEGRPKTFNYVSTLAVFSMRERTGTHVFDESAPIDDERHPSDQGYTTSKWAGEQLTHLAAARGVPCNVFRLGLVTGDVRHGRYDELQAYYRLLKSCILMGAAFDDFRYDLVITPVDYVARALAHLGAKHPQGGRVFHLSTMQVTPMRTVFEMMNAHLPTPMRMLTHRAWIDELRVRYRRGDVQSIVPVVQWMMNMSDAELVKLAREREETTFIYDCTATHRELEEAGIVVPVFDDALLQRYLRGMFDEDADLRALAAQPDGGERASPLHSHT
ncbi:thioester reductase domain-containing protein [Burkholderia thailandensis]|uniref:thioester reductase domain-containing protein n=1 Tax=Burkholderia thailandensis TaxID=57975 RepID=UPI00140AD39D|nr:thioester reductase domain-containing protein [Burkholderia thailandensis]MCS3398804.1 thioester reductase domain-containing protein [Burkholderia thailandensis]QIO15436.1 SDR family NAD(P)-dependent oxidoreductase [Burkholderia thailandensis]